MKDYALADVNVPNPSTGTLNITQNGTYDVTDKAEVVVDADHLDSMLKDELVTLESSAGDILSMVRARPRGSLFFRQQVSHRHPLRLGREV